MMRVGFLLNFPVEYKGGINYLRNLFYALNKYRKNEVQLFLFVPSDLNEEYVSLFKEYATLIKTDILKRGTVLWFISRVTEIFLNFDPLTYLLLTKHKMQVISHSNYVFPGKGISSVNWIPDFQYLHYPHLWTKKQLNNEFKLLRKWVEKSKRIVVSSKDAYKDLISVHPGAEEKIKVLHFVSQPHTTQSSAVMADKYGGGRFYYVPNQFWEHKNHLTVFKALKLLKDKGIQIRLLTSGLMSDYRNKDQHVEKLLNYVKQNDLDSQVEFLGLIPYSDVIGLMRQAVAVINPSLFEGWSSTVEESKSMGKTIILSDIPVHREQAPERGYYFNPHSERELARLMEELWINPNSSSITPGEEELLNELNKRTEKFASEFTAILGEAINEKGNSRAGKSKNRVLLR